MADEALRLSAGQSVPASALDSRRPALQLRQRAVPRIPDARGPGLLDAVHQSARLERLRPRVHVLHTGPLGHGGLPGLAAGRGRRDRARQRRRRHHAHGGARWIVRRIHDQQDRRPYEPLPRRADRPLDLQLVFLVRIVGCAGIDRVRIQRHAVGSRLALPRALADDVCEQHADADADRALRGRQAHADHRWGAAVHVAAQTRRACGVRTLSALVPRPFADRTTVAARRPAGADPHLVRALARHR